MCVKFLDESPLVRRRDTVNWFRVFEVSESGDDVE